MNGPGRPTGQVRALVALVLLAMAAAPALATGGAAGADDLRRLEVTEAPEAPVEVDEALRRAALRTLTDPGDLPQLEVTVDGEKRGLPLQHTHVSAEISGHVARVQVVQRYRNPLEEPIEAVYVFPLPENSAVDDMKIRIGERLIEAEIRRRADARRTYEEARREGYTAALLEQERPNVFTQSIANMEPGVDIEVTLRYVQDLSYDAGEYEFVFPMVVGPRFVPGAPLEGRSGSGWSPDTGEVPDASRVTPPIVGGGWRTGHDISIEVVIAPGLTIDELDVPTHEVALSEVDGAMIVELARKDELPNRDFVLRFRTDQPLLQGAVFAHRARRGGFFSLVLQPPALDVEALVGRREVVFVVDVSGSMSGVPLATAKEAARQAIRLLRPVDTFNVVTFAGHTAQAFPKPRPANTTNVREALAFIDAASAGGGTYLARAVEEALRPEVSDGRHRYVFFLTDGYVGNERRILQDVERLVSVFREKGRRARAFGFGIGSSVNRHLITGIGEAGDGASVVLTPRENPARAVRAAFRLIDRPVIEDVRIDWGGLAVEDVEPEPLPDLLASRPLVLHGRYKSGGEATVRVTGTADGKPVVLDVPVSLPTDEPEGAVQETLWARARVDRLERELWGGHDPDIVEEVTSFGLDYRLVTAYTSFVAVDRTRRVGDGDPGRIVQPVEAPEGVVPEAAAPGAGVIRTGSVHFPGRPAGKISEVGAGAFMGHAYGAGGLGFHGTGTGGGGGSGYGTIHGVGRVDTGGDAGEATGKKDARRAGRVRLMGSSTVTGHVDASVIRRVVLRRVAALRACYERQLRVKPGLAGKLVVKWTIDERGRVKDVEIVEDTLNDEAVASCVTRIVRRMRFPRPAGGQETQITYPFVFRGP